MDENVLESDTVQEGRVDWGVTLGGAARKLNGPNVLSIAATIISPCIWPMGLQ